MYMQERVQRFGGNLAAMVIPNIGAFIAWGLITAFFIPTGWIPNETIAKLVGPMITFLLPLLIGYTGGKVSCGDRGGGVRGLDSGRDSHAPPGPIVRWGLDCPPVSCH